MELTWQMNNQPSFFIAHLYGEHMIKVSIFWVSKIFQKNENLVQLPFTQKFYQKISRSVYDSIFIDTAMDLLIKSFAKTKAKLEQEKRNFQIAKDKLASNNEESRRNSLVLPQHSSGFECSNMK